MSVTFHNNHVFQKLKKKVTRCTSSSFSVKIASRGVAIYKGCNTVKEIVSSERRSGGVAHYESWRVLKVFLSSFSEEQCWTLAEKCNSRYQDRNSSLTPIYKELGKHCTTVLL